MINILLIEDNPADIFLFETYIDGSDLKGARITAVGTMLEAQQQVAERTFQVVVLDLSLPDCQREETIVWAKQSFGGLPIIILSGTNDLALARMSVKEGIQDYLVKDYLNEISLERAINYAIERNQLMNEKVAAERKLVERNHYLEIANRRLEQFAYTVSHDLRAPLARILGLAQIIHHQPLEGEADDLVALIEQSALGLDVSIKDLMEMLVIQKNISKSVTKICVSELLRSVTESLSVQIRDANALVTSDFATVDQVVYPEPVLRSVLLNLLTNAIKYRSPQRPLRVHVALRIVEESWCCLSVSDNGSGIDLSNANARLFKLFSRFHQHIDGKGIGLHMIKSLVEDCGGHIEADSKVDSGTTFRVYLPHRTSTLSAEEDLPPFRESSPIVIHNQRNQKSQVA